MYIIKNGLIIDPQSGFNQVSDMLIDQGKIKQISKEIDIKGIPIIDASNKIVAPGLVDIHVHFREPGQTHKENIHTGALSAAVGGFTTVLMMANTNPTISSPEIVKQVKESAAKEAIKIETVATITKSLNGKDLVNFEELLEAGVAGFSDDGIPLTDTKVLQEAMNLARKHDVVLSLHEEDPSLNGVLGINEHIAQKIYHVCGASGLAEYSMIDFLAKMTCNPAQLYGFDAGYLREGGPADIVIFDQAEERIIKAEFASKSSNSPFIGDKLKGVIHYTICNGEIVYQKDSHAATLV